MRAKAPFYQDELLGAKSTAKMTDVEQKYQLGEDFIPKAANELGGTEADVRGMRPIVLLTGLMAKGKTDPEATELGKRLLNVLRKPTESTQSADKAVSPDVNKEAVTQPGQEAVA
jgi:hypothetical protein